jgi:flagellar biosynthesis GTPase FlhF
MTTITIRAADSAEALEEVMRRLGPDALILSTRQSRGMVEMVAGMAGIAENRQGPPRSNFRAELERIHPDLDEAAQVPEQDAAALSLRDRPPQAPEHAHPTHCARSAESRSEGLLPRTPQDRRVTADPQG